MPTAYRQDVMLAPADAAGQDWIGRVNRTLTAAGLAPAVQPAIAEADGLAVVPVTGADPFQIRQALRRARDRGEDLPELTPDFQYLVGTAADDSQDRDHYYYPSGKRIGHGAFAWLAAPAHVVGDVETWQPAMSPPVVALLDTGIDDHDRLPLPHAGVPFWVDATGTYGWRPPVPVPADEPDPDGRMDFGRFFGHGTFLAGIIRREAPAAQVLSLRVMSQHGHAGIRNVAHALAWLASRLDRGEPVDVVLLAFGCVTDDEEELSIHDQVRSALRRLDQHGVPVVVSAGNEGSERPSYPAAFAADPELSNVVSVGSSVSPTARAEFSNHGPWVREWRDGSNVASLMPLTSNRSGRDGYAWWSGTSFAAARYAAELAQRVERAGAGRSSGAGE